MAFEILGIAVAVCIGLVVVIIIVFLILFFFFKILIEFFPSVVIAGAVFYFTRNWQYTLVAFLASAILFAIIGLAWKRNRKETRYRQD